MQGQICVVCVGFLAMVRLYKADNSRYDSFLFADVAQR
jgi:hypothetical protein